MSTIGIALTDNDTKKKNGGLFSSLRSTQKTGNTTPVQTVAPQQKQEVPGTPTPASPTSFNVGQTVSSIPTTAQQTTPQKPPQGQEVVLPTPSLNTSANPSSPKLYSADQSKYSLNSFPKNDFQPVTRPSVYAPDVFPQQAQTGQSAPMEQTKQETNTEDDQQAQINTIADFLATRPKQTMEEYAKKQERRDKIERITRGLKALANVFTTAYGGVNTYDYEKDKANYETEESKRYSRLAQEWKDYRNNLLQAQNMAFKRQDADTRRGNLLWRQANQKYQLDKWKKEFDLKQQKQSSDEAYKSAQIELKKQQQQLAKERNEDNRKNIEARIKYLNQTIDLHKQRIGIAKQKENRQGKAKTTTYTRDAKGRTTSSTTSYK